MSRHPTAGSALDQGLTLTEMVVTVAILGILTSLLVNTYQQVSRFQAQQAAAAATAEWLSDIRKRAMQLNRACSITASPATNSLEADSNSACGSFPALDLDSLRTGSISVSFCYRNHDPLQANTTTACNSQTTSSAARLTFSPRGTSRLNAVFEFFTGTEQAGACTLVIQPNSLIRYGTIQSGSCQANN